MTIAAHALALDRTVPFNGSEITLRPLDFEAIARLSNWIENRARSAMYRANEGDEAIDPRQLLSAFLDNCSGGHYEPGGAAYEAAIRSPVGGRKIIELMLVPPEGEEKPDLWRSDTSWSIYADEPAFRDILTTCGELNTDPKAVRARRMPTRRATPTTPPTATAPSR